MKHFQDQVLAMSVATMLTKQYEVYSARVDASIPGAGICYGVNKGPATTYLVFTYGIVGGRSQLDGVCIVDYVDNRPKIVAEHAINGETFDDLTDKVAKVAKWAFANV